LFALTCSRHRITLGRIFFETGAVPLASKSEGHCRASLLTLRVVVTREADALPTHMVTDSAILAIALLLTL